MKKILLIGYGNTLRGDDAAGIRAAELFSKRRPDVACVCMHQLMPELSEQIAESDIVFFLDADVNAKKPVMKLIEPAEDSEQPRTHFISPESLLSLSRQLYEKLPEKVYVIGIPASEFEFSEELSENTKRGIEDSINLIASAVNSLPAG
jgi:hydrogenase maturation protease